MRGGWGFACVVVVAVAGWMLWACVGRDNGYASSSDASSSDGSPDSSYQPTPPPGRPSGAPLHPPPSHLPDPQPLACDPDASTPPDAAPVELCPLPPSACADESWVTYYTGGECLAGMCLWEKKLYFCYNGCSGNGCIYYSTPGGPH